MGLGPINASKKALKRANLDIKDIDIVELNEAFASQSIACIKELKINPEIVNIEGGYYAVIKYSGRANDKNFIKHKDILLKELKIDNVFITSPSIRATYDSPFTLPMNRRNEAMFKIKY